MDKTSPLKDKSLICLLTQEKQAHNPISYAWERQNTALAQVNKSIPFLKKKNSILIAPNILS